MADFKIKDYTEEKPKTVSNDSIDGGIVQTNESNTLRQSDNYVPDVSGWIIRGDGSCEFGDGKFRGTFEIGGASMTIDDVADLQDALDEVDAEGGGTVYLKAGTYLLTADISIPSGVVLEGVSRDNVIIDCNTSYKVQITGTNVYSTGTITINNGDTSVIGVGTVWTSAMVGRYILLDGLWYEILTRVSNTEITISAYQGDNLAGVNYVLSDINFSGTIAKVTITNATGDGLVIAYSQEVIVHDVVIYGCGTGINSDYSIYPSFAVTSNENGVNIDFNYVYGFTIDFCDVSFSTTGAGLVMTNTYDATIFNSNFNNNTGDGVTLTDCSGIVFLSFNTNDNGSEGINFVSGCDDNYITDGSISNNASDGIKLTATSDRNTVTAGSIINNGGYGVNIAAVTCDNNKFSNISFFNNTSGDLSDGGTSTEYIPYGYLVAGDNLLISADTERSSTSLTYEKKKELRVGETGTYRIKFDLKADAGGIESYGRIYKNGVALGTEQLTLGGTYVTYSEDLAFLAGDLLQLYVHTQAGGHTAYVMNLRIYIGGRNTLTTMTD